MLAQNAEGPGVHTTASLGEKGSHARRAYRLFVRWCARGIGLLSYQQPFPGLREPPGVQWSRNPSDRMGAIDSKYARQTQIDEVIGHVQLCCGTATALEILAEYLAAK